LVVVAVVVVVAAVVVAAAVAVVVAVAAVAVVDEAVPRYDVDEDSVVTAQQQRHQQAQGRRVAPGAFAPYLGFHLSQLFGKPAAPPFAAAREHVHFHREGSSAPVVQ